MYRHSFVKNADEKLRLMKLNVASLTVASTLSIVSLSCVLVPLVSYIKCIASIKNNKKPSIFQLANQTLDIISQMQFLALGCIALIPLLSLAVASGAVLVIIQKQIE